MSFPLEKAIWSNIFAVPCELVDKHIKLCGDTALRVLLVLLRHGGNVDSAELCALLNRPEDDIRDAVRYWQEAGVLAREEGAAVPPPPPAPEVAEAAVSPQSATPPLQYVAATPEKQHSHGERKVQTVSKSRPRLSTQDIGQMAREDESIAYLLQESQSVLGRPLTPVATDTIVSLYSYYGMQPDLVLMLLQYCVAMDKDSMRYVEKVAATWLENGVDTHEKAEREILRATEISSVEHKVKTAFGIYDRKLVASEQKYVGVWISDYRFDLDMITLAFERAVEQKGKLSFPYINGILSNWYAKGIRTPAQAMEEMRNKQKSASAAPAARGGASYDIDELEQIITYGKLM